MSDYNDAWAVDMQARAFDGDEGACWSCIDLVRPYMLHRAAEVKLKRSLWDDVWSDCEVKLACILASGNTIDRWFAYAKKCVSNIIFDYMRKEARRERAEESYMNDVRVRYTEAYPALHECIALLEDEQHELVQRVYFRPVRQSMWDFSMEFCMNYYEVLKMHRRTLNKLRYMLAKRGITHA